jgi:pSer/pThr/pTyr-binding forkhead associated (FHA) protein
MAKLPVENEITMYHSGMKTKAKTIGRGSECNLVLDHDSVSRVHATIEVTGDAYLMIQDAQSSNGTFLQRNGRWIRTLKVILGSRDRIRFGDQEVSLDRLLELYDTRSRVRLREGYSVRGKPLLFENMLADLPKPKIVLENPRRNPVTGNIEECS